MRIISSYFKNRIPTIPSVFNIMSRDKKSEGKKERVLVNSSASDRNEELTRLMDSYADMTNPWVLSTLHLPLFPYWRDVNIRSPAVDLIDYGDKFMVTAEVPGFEKEDIDISVNGFSLEIKAERDLEDKGKSKNYVQRERLHSSYSRVIQFPQEVTPSKAKAMLRNGLLEIEVPKIDSYSETPRKIVIQ
jgi:HSP20 family molecular chaperone IbpA